MWEENTNHNKENTTSEALALLSEKHALVVEDDEAQRYFLEVILQNMGMKSTLVSNGKAALEKLENDEKFDLVLMDWSMPHMDGMETTRAICALRKKKNSPHIPIVGFTNSDDPNGRDLCISAGMDDYLSKDIWRPRWKDHLEDTLSKWFDPERRKKALLHTNKIRAKSIKNTNILIPHKMGLAKDVRNMTNNTENFASLVFDYIKRAETCLFNINDASYTNDTRSLLKNARVLKSSSRVIGLISVFDAAKTLEDYVKAAEKNGKKMNPLALQEKIMWLEDIFSRARHTLKSSVKAL